MIEMRERTRGEKAAYLEGYMAALHVAVAAMVRIAGATDETVTEMQKQIAVLLAISAKDNE